MNAPLSWWGICRLGLVQTSLGAIVVLVIDIAGESSWLMNMQEMSTCMQYRLPVKSFILNNSYMGMVRQWQEFFHGGRYSESYSDSLPDFIALAEASGAETDSVSLALRLVAQEIGIGIAVGFGLTALGGQLLKLCADRGWVSETWRQLLTLKNTVDILIGTLKPARRLRLRQRSCRFSRRARS